MTEYICTNFFHFIAKYCSTNLKDTANLTIASNYSSVVEKIEHIVDSAQQKYSAGAYVHWYEKHGLEKVSMFNYYV